MASPATALVVATHPQQCKAVIGALQSVGLRPALAFNVEDARRAIAGLDLTLVCCAPQLLDGTCSDVIDHAAPRGLPVVLIARAGHAPVEPALDHRLFACLPFPFSAADAKRVIRRAIQRQVQTRAAAS